MQPPYPWEEAVARSAFAKLTWQGLGHPATLTPEEIQAALLALSWRLESYPVMVAKLKEQMDEIIRLRERLGIVEEE